MVKRGSHVLTDGRDEDASTPCFAGFRSRCVSTVASEKGSTIGTYDHPWAPLH